MRGRALLFLGAIVMGLSTVLIQPAFESHLNTGQSSHSVVEAQGIIRTGLGWANTAGNWIFFVSPVAGLLIKAAAGIGTIGLNLYDANKDAKNNPCGKPSWSIITYSISNAFCGLAVNINSSARCFLAGSADLLNRTAGSAVLPGSGTTGSNNGGATVDNSCVLFNFSPDSVFTSPIEEVLIADPNFGGLVQNAYRTVLRLVNFLLVFAFLVLALMNILQIQMSQYNLKKVIPGLIIAFIVAQFSFFAVRASLEVTAAITAGFVSTSLISNGVCPENYGQLVQTFSSFPWTVGEIATGATAGTTSTSTTPSTTPASTGCGGSIASPSTDLGQCTDGIARFTINCEEDTGIDMSKVLKLLINSVFTLVPAVFILILAFMFIIRRFIFFALIPIAPLAVMSQSIPMMNAIWSRWWKLYSGWLFMPLASGFWLWMALVWFGAIQGGAGGGQGVSGTATWMGYAFGVIAMYLAVKTPFSLAGEAKAVMEKWNKVGRSGWNNTGGKMAVAGGQKAQIGLGRTGVGQAFMRGQEKMRLNDASRQNAIKVNRDKAAERAKEMQETKNTAYMREAEKQRRVSAMTDKIKDGNSTRENMRKSESEMALLSGNAEFRRRSTNNAVNKGRADQAQEHLSGRYDDINERARDHNLANTDFKAREAEISERKKLVEQQKRSNDQVKEGIDLKVHENLLKNKAFRNNEKGLEVDKKNLDQSKKEIESKTNLIKNTEAARVEGSAVFSARQKIIEEREARADQEDRNAKGIASSRKAGVEQKLSSRTSYMDKEDALKENELQTSLASNTAKFNLEQHYLNGGNNPLNKTIRQNNVAKEQALKTVLEDKRKDAANEATLDYILNTVNTAGFSVPSGTTDPINNAIHKNRMKGFYEGVDKSVSGKKSAVSDDDVKSAGGIMHQRIISGTPMLRSVGDAGNARKAAINLGALKKKINENNTEGKVDRLREAAEQLKKVNGTADTHLEYLISGLDSKSSQKEIREAIGDFNDSSLGRRLTQIDDDPASIISG